MSESTKDFDVMRKQMEETRKKMKDLPRPHRPNPGPPKGIPLHPELVITPKKSLEELVIPFSLPKTQN